jgi:hypothetical protein
VNGEVWVGAIATLVGAALGGAISFALSRQQLNDARLQRREVEVSEQGRRSEDRRFQGYSAFLTQARSYRNAVKAYHLHPRALMNNELGRSTRKFQNAARDELGVRGPAVHWTTDNERSAPGILAVDQKSQQHSK